MRLVTAVNLGKIYDHVGVEKNGGTLSVYSGQPWVQGGGGFGLLMRPLLKMTAKPVIEMAKKMAPKLLGMIPTLAKRGAREIAPMMATTALSAGIDSINKHQNLKRSLKERFGQQRGEIMKRGKRILSEEAKKAFLGGGGRQAKRRKKMKSPTKKKVPKKRKKPVKRTVNILESF